jgi:hypothetical protein
MTNLRQRLRKLETRMTDKKGLVPSSPAWIAYWRDATNRILSGEDLASAERIPMAFVDLILEEARHEELLGILSI